MKDYRNSKFDRILTQVESRNDAIVRIAVNNNEVLSLQYFLTRNFYYAVIVDDYPVAITDKESLLEAIYYQVRLVTMQDLNWDALEESLHNILDELQRFAGICLLFKHGNDLQAHLQNDFGMLVDIAKEINARHKEEIKILLN